MGEQWVAELNSEPIIRGVSVMEFYSFFFFTGPYMEQTPVTIDFVYESAEIYTIYQWGRGSTGFREIMGHVE